MQSLKATQEQAQQAISRTPAKSRFWQQHGSEPLSAEQIKVLNRLLDGGENGFFQGISASQYQKVAKVSKATATRHLADLLEKGCLEKLPGGGSKTPFPRTDDISSKSAHIRSNPIAKAKKRPHEPVQHSDPDNRLHPLTEQEIAYLRADMKASIAWALLETIKTRDKERENKKAEN